MDKDALIEYEEYYHDELMEEFMRQQNEQEKDSFNESKYFRFVEQEMINELQMRAEYLEDR